ncbi:MAG: hypothetical protein FWD48_12510 [Oscillospiraceae bacterium]|nr:hypothetical protein [Oscillospiraceae bacterium]
MEITLQAIKPIIHDKLYTLSMEYNVTVDTLVNLALKRFINDVETLRNLRMGKVDLD